MRVIIPVAGEGKRLHPHTIDRPKSLLPVADRPMLAHILEPIVSLEPEEVIFIIGHNGAMIQQWVEDNYSFNCKFIEQDELLGLGYAVNMAASAVGESELLVILGDTIVECDLKEFIEAGDNVLGLRKVDDPQRFGIAEVTDGQIVQLVEKPSEPKSDLALIGLYYFKESSVLFKHLNQLVESGKTTRGEIQLTDALSTMVEDGIKFVPFEVQEWFDCGKLETLLDTNRYFLTKLADPAPIDGVQIIPPVHIGLGARIEQSVIGPFVSVQDNALVRRSVMENCIVGTGAVIDSVNAVDSFFGERTVVTGVRKSWNIADSSDS